ncbi:hypothetical protein IAR50_000582 [Cryptococcus sp. DSM 104548]
MRVSDENRISISYLINRDERPSGFISTTYEASMTVLMAAMARLRPLGLGDPMKVVFDKWHADGEVISVPLFPSLSALASRVTSWAASALAPTSAPEGASSVPSRSHSTAPASASARSHPSQSQNSEGQMEFPNSRLKTRETDDYLEIPSSTQMDLLDPTDKGFWDGMATEEVTDSHDVVRKTLLYPGEVLLIAHKSVYSTKN